MEPATYASFLVDMYRAQKEAHKAKHETQKAEHETRKAARQRENRLLFKAAHDMYIGHVGCIRHPLDPSSLPFCSQRS